MKPSVGIVIGRFQTPELHAGHVSMLEACCRHQSILIFLALSSFTGTSRQPMDFPTRELMLRQKLMELGRPDAQIVVLPDMTSDKEWGRQVRRALRSIFPHRDAVIYHSRDSAASIIKDVIDDDKVTVEALDQVGYYSASEERLKVGGVIPSTVEGRMGVIYASQNRWPEALPCVDIAILNFSKETYDVLLAKRNVEDGWRFPGGHVSPGETYEQAAIREGHEETSIFIDPCNLEYQGSFYVGDWRNQDDRQITTALFAGLRTQDAPRAGDDVDHVKWVHLKPDSLHLVVEEHRPLFQCLLDRDKKGTLFNGNA